MYLGLLSKTAYIYRATETQSGPRTVKSWVSIGAESCRLALRKAHELEYAEAQSGTYRLYLRIGADIAVQDRVVCDGGTYDVTEVYSDVASAGHHTEAVLRIATV